MHPLVIAVVYTLLLAGECQKEGKSPSTAVNGSCSSGNTYTYTMNVHGDPQSSNDEVKEAVKAVVEELLQQKMEEVVDRLEEKIENATEEVKVQMKADFKDLKSFANELTNENQHQLQDFLDELEARQKPHISSCKDLPITSPSGYYWIYNSSANPNLEFCDTTRKCGCNNTGGWMRVANLDMTDPNQQCPDGLRLITSPNRTCGRVTPTIGCASVVYPTNGHEYSHVCGMIQAYQFGRPEAFNTASNDWPADGISLYTLGRSQHIWSFVVGRDETSAGTSIICPCNSGHSGVTTKPIIGQDYFCDTGAESSPQRVFNSEDPLWDGEGCGPRSSCCSFNNPPWFCKQLPQPTTDDIELQMCGYEPTTNEDTPIEIVEIYVQ